RFEVRADSRLRIDHAVLGDRAWLSAICWTGSEAEGAYETPLISVGALSADGRIARIDSYDLDQIDAARARFEERPQPAAARIPLNAAARTRDRIYDAVAAEDWDGMRALVSDDFGFDDRGKRALVGGDLETWIETLRFWRSQGMRVTREPIGTAGDRV